MKSFRIKNIKSFLDSGNIELAPITIFVGKNSCGKSSLLRFPVVLSQTILSGASNPILFNGEYVDYGFFEDVIHKQKGDTIQYEFSYDVDIKSNEDYRFVANKDISNDSLNVLTKLVTMSFEISYIDKKISIKSATMSVENEKIVKFEINQEKKSVHLYNFVSNDGILEKTNYVFELGDLQFGLGGFPLYEETKYLFPSIYMKIYKKEEILPNDLQNAYGKIKSSNIEDLNNKSDKTIKKILLSFNKISAIMSHVYVYYIDDSKSMSYIGPFRVAPSRIYRDPERSSGVFGVGSKGENVANLLVRDYRRNSKIIKRMSKWLKEILGYELSINDMNNGYYQVLLKDKYGNYLDISDVGYGVSQVLPIVAQVIKNIISPIMAGERTIDNPIYIEQPELHLHPAAQSRLADLFSECIVNEGNKCSSKLVIETHSEHLIRRLQVLISDKNCKLTNDMVKIYYVDMNSKGNATVNEMKITDDGRFETAWPTGFFDQAHKATVELLNNTAIDI